MYLWKFFVFYFFSKTTTNSDFFKFKHMPFFEFSDAFHRLFNKKKSTKSRQKVDFHLRKVDEKVDWNVDVKKVDSLR